MSKTPKGQMCKVNLRALEEVTRIMKYPHVDIVLLVWGRARYTELCLNRLLSSTTYPWEKLHLWVVVQGTMDHADNVVRRYAEESPERFEYVEYLSENEGPVRPINRFWERSTAEFVGKIDNDILVTPGWTEMMIDCLKAFPDVGVVGGWVASMDPKDALEAGKLRTMFARGAIYVHHVGGNYIMRKKITEMLGGMREDQDIFAWSMYQENIKRRGWKIAYPYPTPLLENMDLDEHPLCLRESLYASYADAMYFRRHKRYRPRGVPADR